MDEAGLRAPESDDWSVTLAAAMVGAERAAPSRGDLLARVARDGTHHLAGTGLSAEALAPFPPRESHGRACPPAAAIRLAALLNGGTAAVPRLREWCDRAAATGIRAPPEMLAMLGTKGAEWTDSLEPIAGPELAWLARVCDGEEPAGGDGEDWTEGDRHARRRSFVALRLREADGARAALEVTFRSEKAEMRADLVSALEVGLCEADEPFLETCLDDRASGVRAAAQALLPRLPRSRLASRMAERARLALAIASERRLLRSPKSVLTVTLPRESPALERDGVVPYRSSRGESGLGARLLQDVLRVTPLHAFAGHPPSLWIDLALRSEWPLPILDGLLAALRRERDPAWIAAMVGALEEACAGRVPGVKADDGIRDLYAASFALLPPPEWERRLSEAFRRGTPGMVRLLLGRCPRDFSEPFTAACLDWLAAVTRGPAGMRQDLAKAGLLDRIADKAAPSEDAAAAAATIAARLPDDSDDHLRRQIDALAETLDLRAAIRRELT